MNKMREKKIKLGLTFDDVLLVPQYSEVLPKEVQVTSRFTKNIQLNIPIVSAAMDTVTESTLAISLAIKGGIGVIHKNMSIENQATEVIKVKRAQSTIIFNPIVVYEDDTLKVVNALRQEHKISGIPVLTREKKVVGIITTSNVRFREDPDIHLTDIMTKNPVCILLKEIAKGDNIDVEKTKELFIQHETKLIMLVDGEHKLVGIITSKDVENRKEAPNANLDSKGHLRVAAAIGTGKDAENRAKALIEAGVDAIIVDTAHGHSIHVINMVKLLKNQYPHVDIVAGNIATGKAAQALIEAGVDAVKVGIGPGSICTTRIIAGIGVPQLSAIMDVYEVTKKYGIPLIADGGIKYSGDIVKALAAGADTIMAGSLFAGTEESPGETIIREGRKFKSYRGMGSLEAMQQGSKDRYFQEDEFDVNKLVPEGIAGMVPYRGTLKEVIHQLIGGIRAGMGYCGAQTIPLLQENTEFIQITQAGMKESHPHDVIITKEAPNYSK
ncbi:MAG: IMP dehydrogenase [bacterium]